MTKEAIRRITGERFYKRGYHYYQHGKVYGLSYNPQTNSWRGLVKGSRIYTIRIYFIDDLQVETTCNCPAYDTYGTCKHIAAVLLAVTQDRSSNRRRFAIDQKAVERPEHKTDLYAKQLIHTFYKESKAASHAEMLHTSYILSLTKTNKSSQYALSVELKVGDKRPYIIKDVRGFLKAFQKEESYKLNQSFTYDPHAHFFSSNDRALIEKILQCYDQELMFGNSNLMKMEQPRSLIIPPSILDPFLDKLVNADYIFRLDTQQEFHTIERKALTDQLQFHIDYLRTKQYTLEMTDLSDYYLLENYHYLLYQNEFYQLTSQQRTILEKLFRIAPLQTKKKQYIAKEEMDSFVKNVLTPFEKVGTLEMTTSMKQQINTSPLETKVYVEDIDDTLKALVEFHYGDTVFRPFAESPSADKIVKRELAREQEMVQMMKDFSFLELNQAFYLFDDEKIYTFLHEHVYSLTKHASVFLSNDVKKMTADKEKIHLAPAVDYSPSEGMLDITFDMEGISEEEAYQILQALVEKKRFYRIPDGALVDLEAEEFSAIQRLQNQIPISKKELEEGKISLPAARSFQIEEALKDVKHQYSGTFRKMLDQLKNPEELQFTLPDDLQAEMRDYQITGFQWMKTLSHYHLGGILADDMGLGKTLQTISYLLSEAQKKQNGYQALVIAPASLLFNWKKEIEKFAPTLSAEVIIGSKTEREQLIDQHKKTDILITSYPTLRKDAALYESHVFDCIILDEAQAIKNHLTLTAKAVRTLRAKQFFALSGTPIENNLEELWSIFYTVSPGLFGSKKEFSHLHPDYIAKMTRPFILRRIKKEVLDELPDKIETVQYSELTKNQKEVYLGYLHKIQNELDETVKTQGFQKGKLQILAGLTRLRQICCHPSLFLENYQGASGKLDQLLRLTSELEANNKRTLIFSQFSSMLGIIRDALVANGHEVYYLDGSTPSQKRLQMVEAFNEGERGFFLISLKAGGTGLNLTGADTVILYDLWWNPAVEEQAAGRAHRIGQKNVVQVIRFITEGTIEEKIYQMQQKKRELVDQIIQPGETLLSKLSEQEIRELLQFNQS